MQRYPLGRFSVARIGFGAMPLPGPGVLGPPRDRSEALAVLRRAVELGADHIDTAQYYGPDIANELIRAALSPYPDSLALVSKVGARRDGSGAWLPYDEPDQLRRGIEDNLRSLGVDQLAAVNLRLTEGAAPDQRFDDQLAAMIQARDEGLIGGRGRRPPRPAASPRPPAPASAPRDKARAGGSAGGNTPREPPRRALLPSPTPPI